jgi:uncharacterized protein YjeT (DUF2065 family)
MSTYILLAQALGIILSGLSLSILSSKKVVRAVLEETARNQGLLWTLGLITLSMGSVVLVLNNVWSSGLQLVVTILGWLMLIKGLYILLFPTQAASLYRRWATENLLTFSGIVGLIIGLFLLYYGFV